MTEAESARAALVMLLRRKRQTMTESERARRKKPARWLYPWATEHSYSVLIRAWVKPVIVYVREYIQKHHEAVLRGDGTNAVIRNDAVAGQSFYAMISSLNGWVGAYISDDEEKMLTSPIFMGLGRISDSAFSFNRTQYRKSVKSALGIDFPSDESWWSDAQNFWRRQNYDLIRSDIKKYISDINTATEKAVTNGLSVKTLMEEIRALDEKITKSRAKFIARDQIGKLNGIITQKRQEDIGLSMYEWSASGDERVRDSHALMDGKLCRWNDATVYSEDGGKTWIARPAGAAMLHPGQDYQCRCCALAWFDELIDEADGVDAGTKITVAENDDVINEFKTTTKEKQLEFVFGKGNEKRGVIKNYSQKSVQEKQDDVYAWLLRKGVTSNTERIVLTDLNGNIVRIKQGKTHNANITIKQAKENSIILSHNHPSDRSFSLRDILTLNKNKCLKQINVIGHENSLYSLEIPPNKRLEQDIIVEWFNNFKKVGNKKYYKDLISGKINKQKYKYLVDNYTVERLANEFGWEYKRSKKQWQ